MGTQDRKWKPWKTSHQPLSLWAEARHRYAHMRPAHIRKQLAKRAERLRRVAGLGPAVVRPDGERPTVR